MRCQVGNHGCPLRGPDPSGYRPFSAFLSCSFGSTNGSRDIVESIGWLLLKPKQNGDAKQVKIVWTLVVQACKDLHYANAEWCWTFGSFAPLVSDSFTSPILHVDDPCKTLRTHTPESYLKTWALQFQIGIKHDLSPAHSNMLQCSCNKNKLPQYWLSKGSSVNLFPPTNNFFTFEALNMCICTTYIHIYTRYMYIYTRYMYVHIYIYMSRYMYVCM